MQERKFSARPSHVIVRLSFDHHLSIGYFFAAIDVDEPSIQSQRAQRLDAGG
jgi:hypothetical protein